MSNEVGGVEVCLPGGSVRRYENHVYDSKTRGGHSRSWLYYAWSYDEDGALRIQSESDSWSCDIVHDTEAQRLLCGLGRQGDMASHDVVAVYRPEGFWSVQSYD